jgi:hypothetical protein
MAVILLALMKPGGPPFSKALVPKLSPWRSPNNIFSYPEEPLPTRMFTGHNKFIAGSEIQ